MTKPRQKTVFTKDEDAFLANIKNEADQWEFIFYLSSISTTLLPAMLLKIQNVHWFFYPTIIPTTVMCTYLLKKTYEKTKLRICTKKINFRTKKPKKTHKKEKIQNTFYEQQKDNFQSTMKSLVYNNALFCGIVVFLNLFLFRSLHPVANYILSNTGTGVLLLFINHI